MTRPRIGITRGLSSTKPVDEVPATYQNYHARVREAGGEPVDLHPALETPPEQLLDGLDGIVVSGGPDINPAVYGQDVHPETAGISDARDALELGLIRAAMARDLPVFAICRGHQALNVACGGPLLQHIEGDGHRAHDGGMGDSRFHDLAIAEDSKLARILGRTAMQTNSRHHQAVTQDGIAPGLIPTAWSPDGLVEGMESPAHRWVVGVQWHPERPEVMDDFRALFDEFIGVAAQQVAGSRQ
jgi:putative glutamine amidotransferase